MFDEFTGVDEAFIDEVVAPIMVDAVMQRARDAVKVYGSLGTTPSNLSANDILGALTAVLFLLDSLGTINRSQVRAITDGVASVAATLAEDYNAGV